MQDWEHSKRVVGAFQPKTPNLNSKKWQTLSEVNESWTDLRYHYKTSKN
jgi:hypothetical protein